MTAGAAALVGCGFPVRRDDSAAGDGSGGVLLDLGPHLPEGYADEFRPGLWSAVAQEGRVWGPHHTDTSVVLVNLGAGAPARDVERILTG